MNKLQMAHEYAIALINSDCEMQFDKFIRLCWNYADAMQAEADKREVSIEEAMKDHVHDYIYGQVCAFGKVKDVEEEWQPDWSQAPDWANWWAMDGFSKKANWYIDKPYLDDDSEVESEWNIDLKTDTETYICAPSFNYSGNWQDSLRKRPQ